MECRLVTGTNLSLCHLFCLKDTIFPPHNFICREQEIAFISQAYAQVERTNFELEQYKELNRQLYNQLAKTTEEQETLEAQLYETGHSLDQANTEVRFPCPVKR